jgi:hypothetical protein
MQNETECIHRTCERILNLNTSGKFNTKIEYTLGGLSGAQMASIWPNQLKTKESHANMPLPN